MGVLDWHEYFMSIARTVATRSKCVRRQVGAVLADPVSHDLLETGYNGSPSRWPECGDACPRAHSGVEPGSSYDTGPGACIYTHAEANCLLRAGRRSRGAWLYVTSEPCGGCRKLIAAAGVDLVMWAGAGENAPFQFWDVEPPAVL